jgi:hypothetical protein
MKLRRYWFEFDAPKEHPHAAEIVMGCGVTAYHEDDAVVLLRQQMFEGDPLPPIRRVIEDIDVSTLDENHIRPNMGVPVWRGVWFPRRVTV